MGTQSKSGQKQEKNTADRLSAAIANKIEVITVADRELKVYKWNFWTSMRLSETLGRVVQQVVSSFKGGTSVASMLKGDVGKVFEANAKEIFEIIVATIERGNFPDEARTRKWVEEEVGLAEVVQLGVCIGKQNLRPLVAKIKEITGVDVSANAEALGESLMRTSLQNSSTGATPTK